jgi:hypothetical protein
MKYINKFSTNADYQAFTEGGYVTPNVCYVTESKGLKFKPKEKSVPVLITFTINGQSYQCEYGMTWAEIINSDYNPTIVVYDTELKTFSNVSSNVAICGVSGTFMYVVLNGVKVVVNEQILTQEYGTQRMY